MSSIRFPPLQFELSASGWRAPRGLETLSARAASTTAATHLVDSILTRLGSWPQSALRRQPSSRPCLANIACAFQLVLCRLAAHSVERPGQFHLSRRVRLRQARHLAPQGGWFSQHLPHAPTRTWLLRHPLTPSIPRHCKAQPKPAAREGGVVSVTSRYT